METTSHTQSAPGLQEQQLLTMIAGITEDAGIGVHAGKAGQALLYGYAGSYFNTDRYSENIESLLTGIFEDLRKGGWNPTFCTGLAGTLWAIEHLKKKEMIELDEDFSLLNDHLKNSALRFAQANNFDFLHGSDGIVFYLLSAGLADEDLINGWLAALDHAAVKNGSFCCWESQVRDETTYNLSLSHGISSRIMILAETLRQFPDNVTAKILLEGSIAFLLSCKDEKAGYSLFPGYTNGQGIFNDSRLGWCYGDMGNAVALWRTGKLLDNAAWKAEAIGILKHAATRRDLNRDGMFDTGICHGTAGVAHIFHRFYLETGLSEFKEAADFWLQTTIRFGEGASGYKSWNGEKKVYEDEMNMLEGISGVCLVYLGFMSGKTEELDWDACLLLN